MDCNLTADELITEHAPSTKISCRIKPSYENN